MRARAASRYLAANNGARILPPSLPPFCSKKNQAHRQRLIDVATNDVRKWNTEHRRQVYDELMRRRARKASGAARAAAESAEQTLSDLPADMEKAKELGDEYVAPPTPRLHNRDDEEAAAAEAAGVAEVVGGGAEGATPALPQDGATETKEGGEEDDAAPHESGENEAEDDAAKEGGAAEGTLRIQTTVTFRANPSHNLTCSP